jgi:cardiolipin synthase
LGLRRNGEGQRQQKRQPTGNFDPNPTSRHIFSFPDQASHSRALFCHVSTDLAERRDYARADDDLHRPSLVHAAPARLFMPVQQAYCPAPMNTVSSTPLPARPLALANILTYCRIAAVPVVVGLMYWQSILDGGLWIRWVALAVFIAAGITDVLDGYFARMYGQQSSLGRMLDPIADKLLVASTLLMLSAEETIRGWSLLAAVIILCREILVSGLREYLAELRVSVPVSRLAKWKTTWQLVAVGFLIAGDAGDKIASDIFKQEVLVITNVGLALLWLSALVTLYTGYDYMRAGLRHMID